MPNSGMGGTTPVVPSPISPMPGDGYGGLARDVINSVDNTLGDAGVLLVIGLVFFVVLVWILKSNIDKYVGAKIEETKETTKTRQAEREVAERMIARMPAHDRMAHQVEHLARTQMTTDARAKLFRQCRRACQHFNVDNEEIGSLLNEMENIIDDPRSYVSYQDHA